jgi:Na+/proline symporter
LTTPAGPFAPDARDGSAVAAERPVSRRWVSVAVMLAVALACAIATVPVYRHGIAPSPFPSYVPGDAAYQVQRYSAPWIAGAIGLAGLAVILLTVSLGPLLFTRRSVPPSLIGSGDVD